MYKFQRIVSFCFNCLIHEFNLISCYLILQGQGCEHREPTSGFFTHVFESTFDSTEGVAEYISHPKHVEFANLFLNHLDKVLVIDYKPTIVRC